MDQITNLLAIMLGAILAMGVQDTGAAKSIANFFIKLFHGKNLELAPALTAYIVSIPVFGDVTMVLISPLTAIISKTNCIVIFINQLREKVGVMFGNPETTTGGRALKFYSSIRLDVRRVETLKQGGEMVGNHTRIKVVKNKVAPPFKQAEFDIMFGTGISKEGDILDLAAENSIVNKSGAWYAYEGNKIGQGRENAKLFLKEHPDICDEIERKVRIHYHLLPGEEEEQQDVKQDETTPESDAPAAEEE